MSRVMWLNDGFVDPATARFGIDDPGARFGDGLRETIRAEDGGTPWLDRHLARLARSADDLAFRGIPSLAVVERAVREVADRCGGGVWRISVQASPYPTLLVDAVAVEPAPSTPITAVTCRGLWAPGNRMAEHKTIAYAAPRLALRHASEQGAGTALLLDAGDDMGEAATANVFCVIGDAIVTQPVHGLLPGTTRAAVLELADASLSALPRRLWRHCDEIFLTSAVQHVVGVGEIDGVPVGDGSVGPVTRRIQDAVRAAFA